MVESGTCKVMVLPSCQSESSIGGPVDPSEEACEEEKEEVPTEVPAPATKYP